MLIISLTPSFLTWRFEKRHAKLAQARLIIAQSVTKVEESMLSGAIKCGSPSHDMLFRVMEKVQNLQRYPVEWVFFKKKPPSFKKYQAKLKEELDNPECPNREAVNRFASAYFAAFKFQHPVMSFLYSCWLLWMLAGLQGLRFVILTIMGLSDRKPAKVYMQEQYVASSGARILALA